MLQCSSLHLDKDVDVDVQVRKDGRLSLHFTTVNLSDPHVSCFFDLYGDAEQMERVVAALEQGLNEVLSQRVNEGLAVAIS